MIPDDVRTPGHWLAHGFAERAAQWARERGAPDPSIEALRKAAYQASRATADGQVCLPVMALDRDDGVTDAELRQRLLASDIVGTPVAPANLPLVLDDENRLYLHRYFDYERRLAQRLMSRAGAPIETVPPGLRAQLDTLFSGNAGLLAGRVDWQKMAVAMTMMRTLTIISGGPGTGKTTTVVNLLACLLAQNPDCRIALAAPTGKAAARMLDAIRAGSDQLPAGVAARFPSESFTIHRLLGASGNGDRFRHHAGNRLAIDVLVVDEASMLDLALAVRLFEAVPESAKVVLLGDKDQLAAVEAGAVFAEVCSDPALSDLMRERLAEATGTDAARIVTAPAIAPTPLRDSVVWLTESFRFNADSGIGRLAARINAGEAEKAVEWLRSGSDPSVTWIEDGARAPSPEAMARIREGYRPYLEAVRAGAEPPVIFEAFNRFRVLCAEREGQRGVSGMNEAISRWFRAALDHPLDPGPRSAWYPGRPVMVQRNDYALDLYNGDVGIVLADASGDLIVRFPEAGFDLRCIATARLPQHDTAFATTAHKAQGSEFSEVLLILPSRTSRVTRELLYTGVTRAREQIALVSSPEALDAGIAARAARDSGLMARSRDLP
jgi:exodeoxyribonuclease V alpha subunit